MAEGTNVGSIFLDLVVRDTVDKQVQNIASKAQTTAQQAFSGVEKAAEAMANKTATQIAKPIEKTVSAATQSVQKMTSGAENAGKRMSDSLGGAFDKTVELAKVKVRELEAQYAKVTDSLNEAKSADNDGAVKKLLEQQEQLYDKLAAARERFAIYAQAAAEKQAAAEASAAQKTANAAEAAAAKQQEAASQAHSAADPPVATQQISVWQRLTSLADGFRNTASRTFSAAGKLASGFTQKLSALAKKFSTVDKSASRFGTRLSGILYSAFIFNGLSAGLRSITSYFSDAISSADDMNDALANLKGAAANAASPIIQVLTPALSALANTAATVFSYVSKLMTLLTGKISNAASTASKSASSTASAAKKAAASLAGFDEIQKLNSNDSSGDSGSDTAEPNYNFEGKSNFLDSVLAAIEAGQWGQVGALIAQKLNSSLAGIQWPGIHEKVRDWTQNLVDTINGFVSNLDWGLIGSSLGNGLNTILLAVDTFFQGTDWKDLGSGLGTGLNDLIETLDWAALGRVLTDKFKALFEILHSFVSAFDFTALGTSIGDLFNSAFSNIDWPQLSADVCAGIVGLLDSATAFVNDLNWIGLGITIYDCITSIDWGGMFAGLLELLTSLAVGLLVGLGAGLFQAFQDLGTTISGYFSDVGKNGVQGFLNGMCSLLCDIGTWLYDHLVKPVIDGVCDALGIHSPSTVFAEIGINLVKGLLQGIEDTWSEIVKFFTDAFAPVQEAIEAIWEDGIGKTIKDAINGIIGSINGMISGIVSGINSVIKALNKLSFDIPEWVPVYGGKKFGFNIPTVAAPRIPYLADGGVITQPTLAMMGEYAGASNNPEIVAPQSLIAETVSSVMEDMINGMMAGFEALLEENRELRRTVENIELGDSTIGSAANRYNSKMAIVRGVT